MRRTTKPRKYDSLIRRAKSLLLAAETRPGGWRLTDLFPRKTCLYITSLEYALDVGYCERVYVACGVWRYRLTDVGIAAARMRRLPARRSPPSGGPADDVGRVVVLHRAARQRESVTRRVRDGEWE